MSKISVNVKLGKNAEVAQKVVDRLLELVNAGQPLPWVKPWNKPATVTVVDGHKEITIYPTAWNREGKQYNGANVFILQLAGGGEFITFNQCKAEGGSVKKGAKGFPVVYWNFHTKKTVHDDGSETEETIPFLKYYTVFRVSDCEGIKQKHSGDPVTVTIPITHTELVDPANAPDLNTAAEMVIADYIANAGNGFEVKREEVSDRAYYSPSGDYVSVPHVSQFASTAEYYSTLFHELGHSTGHKTRLNRFTGSAANAAFGSQDYSREELVAEMTAATVLNALGLEEANAFRNSAAYIKSWASEIKNDPMKFVTAASRATAASDYILTGELPAKQ